MAIYYESVIFAGMLGFLGSLHCAAMCGPLLLVLPQLQGGNWGNLVCRLLYHGGRIGTYFVMGILVGLMGRIPILRHFQEVTSLVVGVGMIALYFYSSRLLVSGFAPIRAFTKGLQAAMLVQLRERRARSFLILGLLNGLLPCGLVYVAAAVAFSESDWIGSALYMVAFGVGTLPTMLGIGISGKLVPLRWRQSLTALRPTAVCLAAGLLILRGLGLGIPYLSPDLSSAHPACCASR